jgi:hypothetical protein
VIRGAKDLDRHGGGSLCAHVRVGTPSPHQVTVGQRLGT